MNDSGSNFADETLEMVSENANNASAELRKRRSTRIVQAVPLVVTGVDALGRPFVERTSSLIINCHGCRYQSKHYVLKNMWVTMEIPHPETGQPPRTVRGRVAWIQRPRTVRQLFQVALELEVSGNVWGIGFPPEDWTAFPEAGQVVVRLDAPPESSPLPPQPDKSDALPHLEEADVPLSEETDNLRQFPSPASTTDASLQLARQVARLVADAKQQIQAAAREAASRAVSSERRLSFEQWEQKFAAGRAEIANETTHAIERFQQEADEHSRMAHAAAAEALRTELPRSMAPQLQQLTRDLAASLSEEGAAQRNENAQHMEERAETLRSVCREAEETAARLKGQSERSEEQIIARAESAARALEEAAEQGHESATSAATEAQQRISALRDTVEEQTQRLESALARAGEASQQLEQHSGQLANVQQQALAGFQEQIEKVLNPGREEMQRRSEAI